MSGGVNVTAATTFTVGDEVHLKSQPDKGGRITAEPVRLQNADWCNIYYGPGRSERHPASDLLRSSTSTDVLTLLKDGRFAGREAFSKRLTYLKLVRSLRSHVYAMHASKTDFYPYQYKPVLKFLESWKHRLL